MVSLYSLRIFYKILGSFLLAVILLPYLDGRSKAGLLSVMNNASLSSDDFFPSILQMLQDLDPFPAVKVAMILWNYLGAKK